MANLADIRSPMPVNAGHSLNNGRVAWWLVTPNRNQGLIWPDLRAKFPGTLTNMATGGGWASTTRPGGFGQMICDGVNDSVIVTADSTLLDITGAGGITFGAWVYPKVSNVYQLIVGKIFSNNTRQYAMYLSANGTNAIYVAISGSSSAGLSGTNYTVSPLWAVNRWNRILCVYDGATQKLYINGVQANSTASTGSITHQTGSLYIAYSGAGGGAPDNFPLNGSIDDVSVWSRALTAVEIKQDYDLSLIGYPGVLHYPPKFLRQYFSVAGLLARRRKAIYGS